MTNGKTGTQANAANCPKGQGIETSERQRTRTRRDGRLSDAANLFTAKGA